MNTFIDLGFPNVPTPNAPTEKVRELFDTEQGNRMDLSKGMHFAFKTKDFEFVESEFTSVGNVKDYVVVEITLGAPQVEVFSPFPLDKNGQFIMTDDVRQELLNSKDKEEHIFADRNILLERYDVWAGKTADIFETVKKEDAFIADAFLRLIKRKPMILKHASYH